MGETSSQLELRIIFGRLIEESPIAAELFPELANRAIEIRQGVPGIEVGDADRQIGLDSRFFALLEALLAELPPAREASSPGGALTDDSVDGAEP